MFLSWSWKNFFFLNILFKSTFTQHFNLLKCNSDKTWKGRFYLIKQSMCTHPCPKMLSSVLSQKHYDAKKPLLHFVTLDLLKQLWKTQLFSLTISLLLFSFVLLSHLLAASWDKWLLWDGVCRCVCVFCRMVSHCVMCEKLLWQQKCLCDKHFMVGVH